MSEESPEDDDDDFALRAMAFARMRASSFGLGAAMTGFNNMLLSDNEESREGSSDKINSVVSSLVSTITKGEHIPFVLVSPFSHDFSVIKISICSNIIHIMMINIH